MSLDPFVVPGYIVALGTAFLMGAKAVMLVRGGSNGNGHLAPEIRAALQATVIALTKLTERLEHLPTKEELAATAEKNRHAVRADLREVSTGLTGRIDRAEQTIIAAIGRA